MKNGIYILVLLSIGNLGVSGCHRVFYGKEFAVKSEQCAKIDELLLRNDRAKVDEIYGVNFKSSPGASDFEGICSRYKYIDIEKKLESGIVGVDSYYLVKVIKKDSCSIAIIGKNEPQGDIDRTTSNFTSHVNQVSKILTEVAKIEMIGQDSVTVFKNAKSLESWCNNLSEAHAIKN